MRRHAPLPLARPRPSSRRAHALRLQPRVRRQEDGDKGKKKKGAPPRKEATGLLDDEPERAETDFYNGDKYVGHFKNGRMHGYGTYTAANGDTYK